MRLQPITRKERFLNEIVGWGETAPEKPLTPEEFFFAAILGEAVQTPEPLTRYQMYLAKIAGRDIEIPTPITRLEYFLAKAAGMDITVPVPITREEIYWSNYTAIVEFEVENVPPLTYKAIEGTLKNYRIYGNTINGESVGDRTANGYKVPLTIRGVNLFDESIVVDKEVKTEQSNYQVYHQGGILYINGSTTALQTDIEIANISGINSEMIEYINQNYGGYVLTSINNGKVYVRYSVSGSANYFYSSDSYNSIPSRTANRLFFRLQKDYQYDHEPIGILIKKSDIQSDYEPYYTPIKTTLYIPEQLKMVGDNADYIDFKEQKQYFADGTSMDVNLPALPTLSGTNTLSVGTEVQPSKVYVKYKGERQ